MSLEKRKAYVEFSGTHHCVITTPFLQKSINLKDGDVVDLISLEKIKANTKHIFASPSCAFYGLCSEVDEKSRPHIIMEIYAIIDLSGKPKCWGTVDLFDNRAECFKGTIWNR